MPLSIRDRRCHISYLTQLQCSRWTRNMMMSVSNDKQALVKICNIFVILAMNLGWHYTRWKYFMEDHILLTQYTLHGNRFEIIFYVTFFQVFPWVFLIPSRCGWYLQFIAAMVLEFITLNESKFSDLSDSLHCNPQFVLFSTQFLEGSIY